jgi:hypothetical protein
MHINVKRLKLQGFQSSVLDLVSGQLHASSALLPVNGTLARGVQEHDRTWRRTENLCNFRQCKERRRLKDLMKESTMQRKKFSVKFFAPVT